MFTVSDNQIIQRPPTEVFGVAADPQAQLQWDADALESVEKLTAGPVGRGSRFRTRFKALGTSEFEIIEYDPPHHFAWYSSIPRWENWHVFDLEAIPDGTRFSQQSTFKLKGLWKLTTPIVKRLVKKRLLEMATDIEAYLNTRVEA